MLILWCRTDICSCKFSVKFSLMLENQFLVPFLCKLNHISLCFIQISRKSPAKLLILFMEINVFFLSYPRCFGPLVKFQHNIKISIKTARVSRLSVSCDYAPTHKMIWPLYQLVTFYPLINYKHSISSSTRSITNKPSRVVTKSDNFSPIKPNDYFLKWSREITWQIKNVVYPLPESFWSPKFQASPKF